MVLADRRTTAMESMPQTVPSAGFTPPFDYSNFAENFDLSLLPGEDQPINSSIQFYLHSPEKLSVVQPKIFTTYYPSSPESQSFTDNDIDFSPDFQKLLGESNSKKGSPAQSPIHLEVPQSNLSFSPGSIHSGPGSLSPFSPNSQGLLSPNDRFSNYRDNGGFYPSSPEYSLYTPSPGSIYSKSPCEEFLQSGLIKKEETFSNSTSPLPSFSPFGIKEEPFLPTFHISSPNSPATSNYSSSSSPEQILQTNDFSGLFDQHQIKQESTVDFTDLLDDLQAPQTLRHLLQQKPQEPLPQIVPEAPKDHQLLRQVLRDTSFQKKFNIRPIDFTFMNEDIKMEGTEGSEQSDFMRRCEEQISRESIEPVLNLAIEEMRKDVDDTCSLLGISTDPSSWSPADVLSWIRWTSRQFSCPEPNSESWNMSGSALLAFSEKDFTNRAPQGGMILHAQLEIWKAAYSEEKIKKWLPENVPSISSNVPSGDISEDEDDEAQPQSDPSKPTTSRSSSHIHLWQFLKELLSTPQSNGSCIRWLDRTKGIFKIEDSVKVARLWGKRKNRPAMNYDKLSRSIRQYYKKGIMKKTERSQRLVYQFCHPYNL